MITTPDLLLKPFADTGDLTAPPQTSPSGFVNFTDGYTPFYEISLNANNPQAKAVERQVQNYMFNALTKNAKAWQGQGLPVWYASMPGGYSRNAQVLRQGGDGVYRVYRALVADTSADPLTSSDWSYVQTSPEMIRNIPMPMGGAGGPTTALITVATDLNTLNNGVYEISSDTVAQGSPNIPSIPGFSAIYAGLLESISWQAGATLIGIQRYTDRAGFVYTRSAINTAWGAWNIPASVAYLQSGIGTNVINTFNTVNAYGGSTSPSFSLADGTEVKVTWTNAQVNTGPSTFNLNGSGPNPIVGANNQVLQGGEIQPGGAATLRFRSNVGWLLVDTWQGSFPIMQATQSRHAVPLAQVQALIDAAKITQVDWSNIVNKPNVAIQNQAVTFSAVSLINTTPFLDFYYGNQTSHTDFRLISAGTNSLSFYADPGSSSTVRVLYMDKVQIQAQVPAAFNAGAIIPQGQQIYFTNPGQGANLYMTNHDDSNWVLYSLNTSAGTVALMNFNRLNSICTFAQRPNWNGWTPWDTGNFNPSLYRLLSNNTFSDLVTFTNGLTAYNGLNLATNNGVVRAQLAVGSNDFAFNQVNSNGVTLSNLIINSESRQASFAVRPLFNGAVPWDNANFTPSLYRTLTNNVFADAASFVSGLTSYGAVNVALGTGVVRAQIAVGGNSFVINQVNTAGTMYSNVIFDSESRQASFATRPLFNGYTPWDTGNLNPAAYALINSNNQAWMGLVNPDAISMSSMSGQTGGLRISTGANQSGRPATINFLRDSYYGTYIGLDTDNIMKIGGWSAGAASPILTQANLATYLPGALAAQAYNEIGSYGLFTAYAMPSSGAGGSGGTVAGANLRYSASDGYSQGASPPGTWRICGTIADADGQSPNSVSVFQRIA